jgi:hypothetical protein
MSDALDNYADDELEDDSSAEESKDSDDAESKSPKDSESPDDPKRIRDLQSKADKAEARANKLQKRLEEADANTAKGSDEDSSDIPPELREWLGIAKEKAQDSLYEGDERFKEYDLSPTLITGETPDKMKESAKALQELVTQIEGKVRNSVLQEHGFAPEPASSARQEPKNWATMSREEFIKERDKRTGY